MAVNDDFDMIAPAPAGHSLTQDNSKYPWGNPPKHADPAVAMEKAIESLNDPITKENLMKLLSAGVSVESLIEGFVYTGFEQGTFSLDSGLLMKGPLALYIASMAEDKGLPYRFFENDDALTENEISDKEVLTIMKKNNPNMYASMKAELNKMIRFEGASKEVADKGFLSFENSRKENV